MDRTCPRCRGLVIKGDKTIVKINLHRNRYFHLSCFHFNQMETLKKKGIHDPETQERMADELVEFQIEIWVMIHATADDGRTTLCKEHPIDVIFTKEEVTCQRCLKRMGLL